MSIFGIDFGNLFDTFTTGITTEFTNVTSGIKNTIVNFGLDVKDIGVGIGHVTAAGFQFVEDTTQFAVHTTVDIIKLVKSILQDLIKLLPSVLQLMQASVVIIKYSIEASKIMIFLMPALALPYGTVYLIQEFERTY